LFGDDLCDLSVQIPFVVVVVDLGVNLFGYEPVEDSVRCGDPVSGSGVKVSDDVVHGFDGVGDEGAHFFEGVDLDGVSAFGGGGFDLWCASAVVGAYECVYAGPAVAGLSCGGGGFAFEAAGLAWHLFKCTS
jgi:hypothetical protein